MASDPFHERVLQIRERFANNLDARVAEIEERLPSLTRDTVDLPSALNEVHRRVHDLCGIGPTLGFVETGKAARAVERVLLMCTRAARPVNKEQMTEITDGLAALRVAAGHEIKSMRSGVQ